MPFLCALKGLQSRGDSLDVSLLLSPFGISPEIISQLFLILQKDSCDGSKSQVKKNAIKLGDEKMRNC